MSNTIEEFIYESLSWVVLDLKLINQRVLYSAMSIPALLFKDLPGGCLGFA
jgi:hypothetical protein